MSNLNILLSKIPSIKVIQSYPEIKIHYQKYNHDKLTDLIRLIIDELKLDVITNIKKNPELEFEFVKNDFLITLDKRIKTCFSTYFTPVINGTGVVLHTNFGRACLDKETLNTITDFGCYYSNLEMDVLNNERSFRDNPIEKLLIKLFDCEAATVVNNNASAVLLTLNELANGKEVIVSRGELIEVGGGFRIPDIMELSGSKLIEVGTTNKTYISDFEKKITSNTSVILSTHSSNFKIVGFTHEPELTDLVKLGKSLGVAIVKDLGSGLIEGICPELEKTEPTINSVLRAGVDIVMFSGDKLLGGPQAGIILGKKKYIDRLKKNPYYRAFRLDKLTLFLLEKTIYNFLYSNDPAKNNPTLKMINEQIIDTEKKANLVLTALKNLIHNTSYEIKLCDEKSQIGGGSSPSIELPTKAIGIRSEDKSSDEISFMLRKCNVVPRIKDDWVILDMRTVFDDQIEKLITILKKIIQHI